MLIAKKNHFHHYDYNSSIKNHLNMTREEALKIIKSIESISGNKYRIERGEVGGGAYDKHGDPLPENTIDLIANCKSVLFGAVGGPKWDDLDSALRPEMGILKIRKKLDLYANLRPVKIFEALKDSSPVKSEILSDVDILIIRELTGGLYFGEPKKIMNETPNRSAVDTMFYDESEIHRIVELAFRIAESKNVNLTSVDKSNVLETSKLWRKIVDEISVGYESVKYNHMLVDNAAMQLILNPSQFNIIVSENTFGDILTDEASVLSSSLGMLPSASLSFIPGEFNKDKKSLYEPIHGSAPDIAGKGIANPIGMILSTAMMFEYSFNEKEISELISDSVEKIINDGLRTKDISGSEKFCSTSEMGDAISEEILSRG